MAIEKLNLLAKSESVVGQINFGYLVWDNGVAITADIAQE